MREVNEMYLGLNTLRGRSGIGLLIKNHSEGEVMWRDRGSCPKTHSAAQSHPTPFSVFCLRHDKANICN